MPSRPLFSHPMVFTTEPPVAPVVAALQARVLVLETAIRLLATALNDPTVEQDINDLLGGP